MNLDKVVKSAVKEASQNWELKARINDKLVSLCDIYEVSSAGAPLQEGFIEAFRIQVNKIIDEYEVEYKQ